MAGHQVWSCVETHMLARGMVIALDYFNLPPRNNAPPRRDGKAIAKRAIDWAERWYKYLNRRRVNRWHVPNGFAAPPAKITRGHIRTHVVDMNHVYLRIWHLTERQRVRARSGLAGSLRGVPLFNWTQQVRRAQGAAGVPGTLTAAEIAEIMGSNIVAGYGLPAVATVDGIQLRTNMLLSRLPEFLCQLGEVTTMHDFL
ncbi:hypothetical protein N8I77_008315 [Diaporthe amygdali]|uniref:Uncharacterized protein n=1 Tax=Phomopsis amygdali TaxID=1214568 RepID=A0AAD9W4C5_PHOAM|nr:hypothetical protein N8I77_008315 [Diaporthe amygdali]